MYTPWTFPSLTLIMTTGILSQASVHGLSVNTRAHTPAGLYQLAQWPAFVKSQGCHWTGESRDNAIVDFVITGSEGSTTGVVFNTVTCHIEWAVRKMVCAATGWQAGRTKPGFNSCRLLFFKFSLRVCIIISFKEVIELPNYTYEGWPGSVRRASSTVSLA